MGVSATYCVSQNYHDTCGNLVLWESELPFYTFRESELPFCVSHNYHFVELTAKIAPLKKTPVFIGAYGSSDLHIKAVVEGFL